MPKSPSIREVLQALDWVRVEMMRVGSPDFIRQREIEGRIRGVCAKLLRPAGQSRLTPVNPDRAQRRKRDRRFT
jgi:hypothetical protein